MKTHLAKMLPICLLIIAISCAKTSNVTAMNGTSELSEIITVMVNCTTANVYTSNMIMSTNATLIHFPTGVDMDDVDLEHAITIGLMFSTAQSFLVYAFNNTDSSTARSIADAMAPSISTAFDTTFVWSSTGTDETYVNVTYSGSGKSVLSSYTGWLVTQCLASDVDGFSQAFSSMAGKPNTIVGINAPKDEGGFDWAYMMMVAYNTSISVGSGNHVIDILDLIDASSLAPSQYAYDGGASAYMSMVMLQVFADEAPVFVECEPGLISPPEQLRGWYVSVFGTTMTAYFSFADDPTPVSPLKLTFAGTVVPEFPAIYLPILSIAAVVLASYAKRRFRKKLG